MQNSRPCNKCGQIKFLSQFHKKKTGKYGVSQICKDCEKIISAEWRKNNRERKKATDRAWQLANPEKKRATQKAWEEKNADAERERKREHYQKNKELWRERGAEWSRNNKDKENAKKRRWRANNPEKARNERHLYRAKLEENGVYLILPKEMNRLLSAPACFYCKKPNVKITLDHVIPVDRGGTHSIGNLLPACQPCNSSKMNRFIMEWRLGRKRVIREKQRPTKAPQP